MNKLIQKLNIEKQRNKLEGLLELKVLNPFNHKYSNIFTSYTFLLNLGKLEMYFYGMHLKINKKKYIVTVYNIKEQFWVRYSIYSPCIYLYTLI